MLQLTSAALVQGRRRADELGATPINPTLALSPAALLSTASGARSYLPDYRSAARKDGGATVFSPSMTQDGQLTVHLEAMPPAEIAGAVGGAVPLDRDARFTLTMTDGSGAVRVEMAVQAEGEMRHVSAKLDPDRARRVRDALFDVNPSVAIEVTQTVRVAAQQTLDFVRSHWADDTVRAGLLALLGGTPVDSPDTFCQLLSEVDPGFARDYLVLDCTYAAEVPAPPLPGYVRWRVTWKERVYNYYQDNQDQGLVFFLPDEFVFGKGLEADARAVTLYEYDQGESDDSAGKVRGRFRYFGVPVVDRERIDDARTKLRDEIGVLPHMVSLQDAHGVTTTFTQYLPNADGLGSLLDEQKDASIDLAKGLCNEAMLDLTQLTAVCDAVFTGTSDNPLFTGRVDVDLLHGRYKDEVVFNARLPAEGKEKFLDSALQRKPRQDRSFPVRVLPGVFKDTGVALVVVKFAGSPPVTLDAPGLKTARAVRSIKDVILGAAPPTQYAYQLKVVREDGASACQDAEIDEEDEVLVTPKQVAACTKPC